MKRKHSLQQESPPAPRGIAFFTSLTSATTSGFVLWATWFFYKDLYDPTSFHWWDWLQPGLQILACFMGLVAAALLVVGKPSGWDVLKMALGILPIILLLRLVIVVLAGMGRTLRWISENAVRLIDGTFLDRLGHRPGDLLLVVGIVLVLLTLLNWAIKKYGSKREK